MENKRFEEVYKQGKLKIVKVIRDNETGVLYMLQHRSISHKMILHTEI